MICPFLKNNFEEKDKSHPHISYESGENMKNKVRGALIGAALGDAWGAPVEKLSPQQIKELYGVIDSLDFEHYRTKSLTSGKGYGRITDDTLMTMFLCDIYTEQLKHLDAYSVFSLVKKIYFSEIWVPEYQKEMPLIERLFYPEKYIFLSNYLAARDPRSGGVGNMVNCGAAMYVTPIGIVNACDPQSAYNEAIAFAAAHQTSYGLEAAGVFAACVAEAFSPDATVDSIINTALELAKDGTRMAILDIVSAASKINNHDESPDIFHKVLAKYSPMGDNLYRDPDEVGKPTENYTPSRLKSIEELPIALGYIVLNDGKLEKALIEGVNSGRDTDSIGVMIGAICGGLNGVEGIQEKHIEKLKQANQYDFVKVSDKFYETVCKIHEIDEKNIKVLIKKRSQLRG